MQRERLDQRMAQLGLAESRAQAGNLIKQGLVTVDGVLADKASRTVLAAAVIRVLSPPRYVSRGALKLQAAADHFGLDFRGCTVLDIGASTGGFTDYSLQHGAVRVVCVDVGRGQLHPRLACDERVCNLEGVNARELESELLPVSQFDRIVIDVSFISLSLVLMPAWECLSVGGVLVALIKPQFEAGRQEAARGRGIIRDDSVRQETAERIRRFALTQLPQAAEIGLLECPVAGADGNREYLLVLQRRAVGLQESADV